MRTRCRFEGRILLDALWEKGPPAVVPMEDAVGVDASGALVLGRRKPAAPSAAGPRPKAQESGIMYGPPGAHR